MSNILARYLSLAMVIHLWIPLSSSTSALCWNDLKHIFHGSAALNCLFFFFFSLLWGSSVTSVLPASLVKAASLVIQIKWPSGSRMRTLLWGAIQGQTPPWSPHCLGRGCSVHGIEQIFLPAHWEKVSTKINRNIFLAPSAWKLQS